MTIPDEAAFQPGHPPILWAGSLASPIGVPWRPGFAVWHRDWEVWVPLVADSTAPLGNRAPHDSILLAPKTPAAGMPDLAARIDRIEKAIKQMRGES